MAQGNKVGPQDREKGLARVSQPADISERDDIIGLR